MKIDTQIVEYTGQGGRLRAAPKGDGRDFTCCLADQLKHQPNPVAAAAAAGLESVKEKGFTGFFAELVEKRLAEMRGEILAEMGLTEEDLAGMDPEARAKVEKMIAQKIQERLAADSDKAPEERADMDPLDSLRYRASMAWKPDTEGEI